MQVKDLVFEEMKRCDSDTLYLCVLSSGERISVLDRETGFSWAYRDIETGYRSAEDKFWLASGMFDIRDYPDLDINEAIELIKFNANTCVGD